MKAGWSAKDERKKLALCVFLTEILIHERVFKTLKMTITKKTNFESRKKGVNYRICQPIGRADAIDAPRFRHGIFRKKMYTPQPKERKKLQPYLYVTFSHNHQETLTVLAQIIILVFLFK